MIRTPSILAVSEHTGWAYVVCVSARERRPFVITRRRITLIDRGLPTQPYEHETRARRPDEAEALVANVRNSVGKTTDLALGRLVDEVSREHPVTTLTIRKPPFEKLPASVAAVHASYQLLCSADGVLYHLAICNAAKRLGLGVQLCPARRRGRPRRGSARRVTGRGGGIRDRLRPSIRSAVDRGASSRLRRGDWRTRAAGARPDDRVTVCRRESLSPRYPSPPSGSPSA